jgi:hypothetical protein
MPLSGDVGRGPIRNGGHTMGQDVAPGRLEAI